MRKFHSFFFLLIPVLIGALFRAVMLGRLAPGVLTAWWDAAGIREEAQREGGVVRTDTRSHLSLAGFNPSIPLSTFLPRCWQPAATSLTPTLTTWTLYLRQCVDTVMKTQHEKGLDTLLKNNYNEFRLKCLSFERGVAIMVLKVTWIDFYTECNWCLKYRWLSHSVRKADSICQT